MATKLIKKKLPCGVTIEEQLTDVDYIKFHIYYASQFTHAGHFAQIVYKEPNSDGVVVKKKTHWESDLTLVIQKKNLPALEQLIKRLRARK